MVKEKILIVDDDQEIIDLISIYLSDEGYRIITAQNGKYALKQAWHENPHLVILDVLLPDLDGIEICQELRRFTDIPILFLSCKKDDVDKIVGLRVGGDDYITKPFNLGELAARVKAHLRRSKLHDPDRDYFQVLSFPGLRIDLSRHEVTSGEAPVFVSVKEFQLLTVLARNPNRVFHQDHLFDLIWGTDDLGDTRTVAVHISNLRKKIEPNPTKPRYILTVRGAGYKFNIPSTAKDLASSKKPE